MMYEYLAKPENPVGLQPLLTAVEVLEETVDADGIATCLFHNVETFRIGNLPVYNNRKQVTGKRTKPFEQMEYFVKSFPNIRIHFLCLFQEGNATTRLTQKVRILQVNLLSESFVFKEVLRVQKLY